MENSPLILKKLGRLLRYFYIIILLMLLLSASLISSCGKTELISSSVKDSGEEIEREARSSADFSHLSALICEHEDVLFFENRMDSLNGDLLYYYDMKSKSSGPLCGKPDCLHDDETCNAYIGLTETRLRTADLGLCFYQGKIWIISRESDGVRAYSMKTDGTDRVMERFVPIQSDEEFPNSNILTWIFQDNLFVGGCYSYVSEGKYTADLMFLRYSLNSDESEEILKVTFDPEEEYDSVHCSICDDRFFFIVCSADYLNSNGQFSVHEYNDSLKKDEVLLNGTLRDGIWEARMTETGPVMSFLDGEVQKYESSSMEWRSLCTLSDPYNESVVPILSDRFVYTLLADSDLKGRALCAADLATGEKKTIQVRTADFDENAVLLGNNGRQFFVYYHKMSGSSKEKLVVYNWDTGEENLLWEE